MDANETREPTLVEIMEMIKKSKDEVIKEIERSRRGIWITSTAFGGSIALFGASVLGRLPSTTWGIWFTGIVIFAMGFIFMGWSNNNLKKSKKEWEAKWNKPQP
jgi:hypothetical protein